jgi:glycosyltransferase involved in cell wall biosynthesis
MTEEKEEILFTIVTPVYNGADWIGETVDSVLSLCADENFEYIVVNDGSTDATQEVLAKYEGRIRVENQKNQGEANAVNRGLMIGSGEFALIVSADDPMRSFQLLSKARTILDEDRSIMCAYPDWSVIDSSSQIIRDVIVPEFSEKKLIGEFNCIVGPGGVFRRREALLIGGRDSQYKFTSDYDFWLRLSRLGRFQRIPGQLAYWREHELSTSIAFRGLAMGYERIKVIKNFLDTNSEIPKELKNMARGYSHLQAALLIYFDKTIPAKRWLFQALIYYPNGLRKFSVKVMLYILLFPISPVLLEILRKTGIYRKPPSSA